MNEPYVYQNSNNNNNKIILFVILLALVVLGGYFFYTSLPESPTQVATENKIQEPLAPPPPEPGITATAPGKLPEMFPKDFLIDGNAKIENGYNADFPDKTQASVLFESKKTPAQIYKTYSDYLVKAGWKIVANLDDQNLKSIVGTNSKGTQVIVSTAINSITKVNEVNITFVYPK